MSELQKENHPFLDFVSKNKKALTYTITALAIVIVAFFGYTELYQKPREEKAADAMFTAEKYFAMDSSSLVLNGDGQSKGVLYIIKEFGGWNLFQELLKVLDVIAKSHNTDIGTIASAYIVNRPGVAAVIVGARNLSHLESNLKIPTIKFNEQELGAIAEVLSRSKGPKGPVYYLERYNDEHRNIMHTNNN